jgi:CRP-like cAMP-binding protein
MSADLLVTVDSAAFAPGMFVYADTLDERRLYRVVAIEPCRLVLRPASRLRYLLHRVARRLMRWRR